MRHVFIGGCGRSGTTLLGSMLGTHSECLATPESRFLMDVHRSSVEADGGTDAGRFFEALGAHALFRIWGIPPPAAGDLASDPARQFATAFEHVVVAYGTSVGASTFDTWIDHTPENVNRSAMLRRLFPEAKLIHVVRDGRAVASSVMGLDWGPSTVAAAARWWTARTAAGITAESFFGPASAMRVAYEDLVEAPERTVADVFRFLGLSHEKASISGADFVVPQYTAGQHQLIGRRPDPGRANAWREALTSRQIEIFESIAGDMLIGLGYTPLFGMAPRSRSKRERLTLAVREAAYRRVINPGRYRRRLRTTTRDRTT